MIPAAIIVHDHWRAPWTFKANGDLHIHYAWETLVIKEAAYVPKSQRVKQ